MDADRVESTLSDILRGVRGMPLVGRRLADDMASGGHRSALRGSGIEFGEVREYVPGDDPRAVDPSVTARMGRLFVKRFVDERERTVICMLDVRPGMDVGFGTWSLRDAAIRLLASTAWSAVEAQDRVGFVTVGGPPIVRPAFGKGASHFARILRAAIVARAVPSRAPFVVAFETVLRAAIRRSLVVLVTDGRDIGEESRWRAMSARHDVVVVRLRPPERDFPDLGAVRVTDGAAVATLSSDDPTWRTRHAEAWRREDAAFEAFLRRIGADGVTVDVPSSPAMDVLLRPLVDRFVARRAEARA